jgi:hypothetical protein
LTIYFLSATSSHHQQRRSKVPVRCVPLRSKVSVRFVSLMSKVLVLCVSQLLYWLLKFRFFLNFKSPMIIFFHVQKFLFQQAIFFAFICLTFKVALVSNFDHAKNLASNSLLNLHSLYFANILLSMKP